MTSTLPAVESILRSLSEICAADDAVYSWENPRRFSALAKRLQLVLNPLLRSPSPPSNLPQSAQTSLKGIAGDLKEAAETLSVYRNKSKIFVLINCCSLCASLQERTIAIGGWLALLESALHDNPDLRKKVAGLSEDMKQLQYRVTENEERVRCTLEKEGQGRRSSKAIQSAIVMDLARALGLDPNNHSELLEQVLLLKKAVASSNSVSQRRIVTSLEGIMDSWSAETDIMTQTLDINLDDDEHMSPFKNFLCPLTKEVMKAPVVLESSQTYERSAIEYWFEWCIEEGRDPTCPVSGQVLKSLELKPNIGLAGAIEEWVNRNIEIHIKSAMKYLCQDPPSVDCVERVLDNIYKISEEHPSSRYKVRNAGVVVLIVRLLRNSSRHIGSHLRSKALMTLLSMAKDEDSKNIMLEEKITRLAIHSLTGSSEKEKEFAVRLILEFSSDEAYCKNIASEKGALVLLASMAGNLEHPALSNLAEEVLKLIERVEDNVQHLAAAGRFEPLLSRLCGGSDNIKIEMASLVGRMTLTNSCKEQIARQGGKILVELLNQPEGRLPSLQALYSLSSVNDNASILVDSSVLPVLTDVLFKNHDALPEGPELKELAASTIANIVSNPGHWELASADKEGHSMQSEYIIFSLLGLLSRVSPRCQLSILQILSGIASSPQASESVTLHIKSGDGFKTIVPFLEHPDVENRISAYRLIRVLSERFGEDLANEFKPSNKLSLLKDKILDNQSTDSEKSDAACILASLTLSEDEVNSILDAGFVRWTIATLRDQYQASGTWTSRSTVMVEGLLGLLLHLARNFNPQTVSIVKEHCLMTVFCEALVFGSKPRVKQLAALGLKYLSESRMILVAAGDSEPQPPHSFCSCLVFICGRAPSENSKCPMHNARCEEDSQFCLLKSNCIKPLVDLLSDQGTNVQIAAVEALSTLVLLDTNSGLKQAVDELERLGVIDSVIGLFSETRPGELQEKVLWMLERVLRVESQTHHHALNQALVRALVEALKHGNAAAKTHAQEALTNLKQISGISGKTSSQSRGWR